VTCLSYYAVLAQGTNPLASSLLSKNIILTLPNAPPSSSNLQSQYVGICDSGCKTLYTPGGSYVMESGRPVYESCNTGKSASNAMVSQRSFVETQLYTDLIAAMGLSSSTSAAVDNAMVKDEDSAGLWSTDTAFLYKLSDPKTDEGFKKFFTAYNSFREIRRSDVSINCHSPFSIRENLF
jgi:hypothetical protein